MYARGLQGEKRSEEAFTIFRDNAKKHPDQWFVHSGLARMYCAQGKFDDAAKEMKLALAGAPDNQKGYVDGLVKKLESKQDINQYSVVRRHGIRRWPCGTNDFEFLVDVGFRRAFLLRHFRVLEHSPSRLAAEPSCFHVLRQQRARPEFFAEGFMQVFENVEPGIEADQIHEFERSHGMVEAEFERLVDISGAGDAFLQHVESFIANHGVDAAGNEAGCLFDDDNFLAHALPDFDGGGQSLVIGFECAHNFEQFHLVHGIEKVHPNALLCAIGNAGDLGDAERRSIRSENGSRTADLVEHGEDFDLRFHFLGNGLDDEIGLARGLIDGTGILQPGKSGVGGDDIDFAEFDRLVEMGADFRFGFAQGVRKKIFENSAIAAERGSMRDAPAHSAGADHRNRADLTHSLPACSLPANSRC